MTARMSPRHSGIGSSAVQFRHGFAARRLRLRRHVASPSLQIVRRTCHRAIDHARHLFLFREIENLGDVWQAGGRLYVRCNKPRREGLKSVRACGERYELDVYSMLWTHGRAFPFLMLSSRMRCPTCGTCEVAVTLSLPGSVLAAAARRARCEDVAVLDYGDRRRRKIICRSDFVCF